MKKSSEPTTEDFLSTFERIVNAAWGLTDEYEPEPRAEVWFFLDDEREPVLRPDRHWVIFRTGEAMVETIRRFGLPDGISLDHDLGDGRMDGQQTARALVNLALDGALVVDQGFTYVLHSQNPVGWANMASTMDDLLKILFGPRM